MAERVRPLKIWSLEVKFSKKEWTYLASSSRSEDSESELASLARSEGFEKVLEFPYEVQVSLLECVDEYVKAAISHHQAAPRTKVEPALRKICNASKNAANELINMQDSEESLSWKVESDPYYVTRTLIEGEYDKKFGREIYFAPTINCLKEIEFLCENLIKNLESAVLLDTHLDILLYGAAEIFARARQWGPTSKECVIFVQKLCSKVLKHLKRFYGEDHIFRKLKSVADENPDEGKERIITRILSGRRAKEGQLGPGAFLQ